MSALPSTINGDQVFRGNVTMLSGLTLPSGAIVDKNVATGAAIAASKLIHDHRVTFAQDSTANASNQTRAIYTVNAVGGATVLEVEAFAVTPPVGADTATVDVKVAGTSILSAPISLANTTLSRALVAGTISNANLTVNSILEVVIVNNHSSGTPAAGVGVNVQVTEALQ